MSKLQADTAKITDFTPKYARQLEVIQDVSRNISSTEKMELVLETALHHLVHLLGYQAAQIYRLSPSGKDLWLFLEYGAGSKPVTQNPDIFSVEEDNIVSHTVHQGEAIYLPDIHQGPYSFYSLAESGEVWTTLKSELALPLHSGQECVGVLRVQSEISDGFDTIDTVFLTSLAALLASAVKNSQTIQRLQDDLQEIKILYNLQRQDDLSRRGQLTGKKALLGYEYDRTAISEVEQPSPSAQLALTKKQIGVSTTQEGLHQELLTPIKLYGETIGIIGIEDSAYGEEILPEDISLLEEISTQVALAIENARLLQQTQERTKELSLLFDASRQLSETIDLQQIHEILATQIKSYFNADSASVWLVNKARTHFEQIVLKGQKSGNEPLLEAVENSTMLQQILRQPAFVVEHPVDDTIAAFPLIVRNKLIGYLRVRHINYHRDYSKNEVQLAQAIITQVTVAIENAQLFQQTQIALSETQKLYEISRSLAESTDLDDIFAVIVESVRVYDVDRVSISLLDRTEAGSIDSVTIVASWDRDSDQLLPVGSKFSADNFSLVHAFTEPPFEPLVSEDLSRSEGQDPRMDDAFRQFMQEKLGAITLFSAPMFLGTEYKGVLSISTRKPHHYTKQEIRIYQTLTDQAIVAIENLRLLETTTLNLYNAEILSHLSQDLLVADTVETIYNLTLQAIADTNPDRGAGIFMYDQIEGGVELELVALWDNPQQQWPPITPGARFSTAALGLEPLLKTGQTVISSDATQDPRFSEMLRQLLVIMQINTLVAVPTWLNREVGGFILVGSQKFALFSPEITRLYEDIARQISGALENRRLFEETQYRATLLQTAAEISRAATGSLELNILLPQTVELICERFGFYHVSIFLVDEYRKYAVVEASTGEVGRQMLASRHKFRVGDKSIVGTVAGAGAASMIRDTGKDAVPFNYPLLPDTHSEMALPLTARGQVIGVLDVHSAKQAAFSQSDITILQSMADQIANAIEAARSFQASRQTLEGMQKLQKFYLNEQWSAYLKAQPTTIGYRLTEEGFTSPAEPLWHLDEIERTGEVKHPVLIPVQRDGSTVNGPRPNGKGDATSAITSDADDPSLLIAPLTLHGQIVIGALDFEIPAQDQLDEDALIIIDAVANQAAQAIESVRQFEQTQAARKEAEALYEVGRTLVATEDEQEMLYTVLSEMLSTLGLLQGGVLFFEEDRKFGKLHALFVNGEPAEPGLRFPIEGNLSYEKLISTKQPVAIEDAANDPLLETVREINKNLGIASLLLIPIIINDTVVGAIGADAIGKKHIFTEKEINLALAMADQLSIMLQNRRLLDETKRRAVQLQTSSDVGRVATSILDQETMLSQAVELIRDRFGFYHVQIFLIDEVKQYAVLYKSTGKVGQKLLALGHKLAIGSQSVIGQVTYQRQSIVVRDTDAPDASTLHRRNEFLPETRAELAIPLQVGDHLIGALDVQSTSPNAFSIEDIAVLETLAAQLAIAIQNARAFKEQQETAERLKEIDKLKTQFLANMSHELRTPLNSIIGFSRVILKGIDGPLTELQKTDLTSIHNSGQHLLGLINNILDLSKIEAGKMELNFEEVELEPIIKGVMSTAIALVKDKPVTLHQEIPANLPQVLADPTRIRQIILNLVSNACKFTEEGNVTIRAKADQEKVLISVRDTGIGIPEENLATVFEEFTQVDSSTTRKVGGTGLGLPISRHFVEMHKGHIWVESKLGYGSTFYFTIPIQQPVEAEKGWPTNFVIEVPREGRGKVIVAIDDDPGVITLYERFLEQQDYRVIGINHSHDVLPQVKELAPAAILLDVLMPEKDGWGVLRTLKDDPATKDIPVIICSIISDKNRGFSLGAADYLIKPIVENELVKALKHLDSQNKEQVKVLVVDDQADDILLIRRILEAQSNYKIFEASNGQESLELVHKIEPDLIILDLTMPKMDGFKVVEALKNNEKTRSIPIIIASAKELTPVEHLALTGQVEVLLRKGIFTENELLEDVSQALKRIQSEVTVKNSSRN
ncbi:MAG: GAF domain-containing protein [Anaerolineales bacterium]|nr:GAF domain-containing protein [Anaerolineales bacterium]